MNIDEFLAKLEARLAILATADDRLDLAVSSLSQAFGVKPDEVAIFHFDPVMELLSFLRPARLRNAGTIPLVTYNALVARTARESKGSFNNTFAATPHASFFECFRTDQGTPGIPIQKIMSAPLEKEGKIGWVIQVSRKGVDPESAGRDFTKEDLNVLSRIGQVIARHL
jgi:hypothetical protein